MSENTIEERAVNLAHYIIDTKDTVRGAAKKFGVSKSTVHKDLQDRLPKINKELYGRVQEIMQQHIDERHIRGGESTRNKYKNLK